jgi:hypothetical protein
MRRKLINSGQRFVAVLLLAIGLSFYGCKDTVSISDDVAVPLSSLTVTPGTLQPAFFSNTTNYKVNAPTSATSVTVTASPKSSTVTMTINGVITVAGQGRSIPLGAPGSTTTILIELLSQTGSETTYTITVTRLLSSDNNLSALDITPGNLVPPFDPDIEDYTANVGVLVERVDVSATKSDPNAVMSGSVSAGSGTASGQATIQLGGPGSSTPVSITVTAPNGTAKTYRITVNRLSDDNNLSELTVTPGVLSPAFASNTLNYGVDVATDVTDVTVTATKSDPNAVLSGSIADPGAGQATGQATIQLDGPGTTTPVTITVTAPNGEFKTYTITVNRAASGNNNLSELTVSPGTLDPVFTPETLPYTVNVATDVTEVNVTATKADPNAILSGSIVDPGAGQATGQATIPLGGPGSDTPVSITVTAPNGDFKTYTITVNRAAPASDNNLAALTVTGGPLVPDFAPGTTTYTVDVPFSVDSVTVSGTKSDPNAVMSGDVTAGAGVATGQATFLLVPLIPTSVSITVTAPNGDSKTYSIVITRALL